MNICLKTSAKQLTPSRVQVLLDANLPSWIQSPCEMTCVFDVSACHGYYLLKIAVDGLIQITCQRCLDLVQCTYHHQTTLAVCSSDERAERLMECFDCIVSQDDQINLNEILIGELYLNLSERPHEFADCHLDMALFT